MKDAVDEEKPTRIRRFGESFFINELRPGSNNDIFIDYVPLTFTTGPSFLVRCSFRGKTIFDKDLKVKQDAVDIIEWWMRAMDTVSDSRPIDHKTTIFDLYYFIDEHLKKNEILRAYRDGSDWIMNPIVPCNGGDHFIIFPPIPDTKVYMLFQMAGKQSSVITANNRFIISDFTQKFAEDWT
jgi:hypothetical protein